MKRLLIVVVCVSAIIFVALLREDYFEVVRPANNTPIEAYDKSTNLLFVGDIMLGRAVEGLMKEKGEDYPFQNIGKMFSDADAVIANLEGPVLANHKPTPSLSFAFSFATTVPALIARHNVQVVSLANNHTYDFGVSGFTSTQKFLVAANVSAVGDPFAAGVAFPVRKEWNGQSVLFVAFNFTNPHFNVAKARADVKKIERKPGDYLITLIHGGDEYKLHSNTAQQAFYRGLIDDGVDAVIAHHPHVVEEIEVYKGKPIFYSLGNFIFDQYFSVDVEQGLALRLTLSKTEARYELLPIQSVRSQPRLMDEREASVFLQNLASRSSKDAAALVRGGVLSVPRL